MPEIVYVLTNPAMPKFVKIGMTQGDVEERRRYLSRLVAVPLPFECRYAAEVENAKEVEKILHDTFADERPNKRREFFIVAPHRIIALLKKHAISNVTPQAKETLNKLTSSEDKLATDYYKSYRKAVDKLKQKGWKGIVDGIGSKSPKFKELRQQLNIPFTKGNAKKLRAIIENDKSLHTHKRTALSELIEEKFG